MVVHFALINFVGFFVRNTTPPTHYNCPYGKNQSFDNEISYENFHKHPLVKSKDSLLYASTT